MCAIKNAAPTGGPGPDSAAISPEEMAERRADGERARHSLRLEGLAPSPEAEALCAAWERGEITGEEMTARVLDLHRRRD